MQKVYLARKNGVVIHHTDKDAMLNMDALTPEKVVSSEEFDAAGGLLRIINNEIVLGKTTAELEVEKEIQNLNSERTLLQEELDDRDYKIIQAAESGLVLSEVDPKLHERRDWCRERIRAIRKRLEELESA